MKEGGTQAIKKRKFKRLISDTNVSDIRFSRVDWLNVLS